MWGKNTILGEEKVNLPIIKRIISKFFCTPDIMRFSDFKDFSQPSFYICFKRSIRSEIGGWV